MCECVSVEFVERIRETQRDLACEWSMNCVEKKFREEQYAELEKAFEAILARQKRHYMLVYMIQMFYTKREWPEFFYSFARVQETFESVSMMYTSAEKLFERAVAADDPGVIDAMTFSIVPCYCDFFFTDFGIDLFVRFVESVRDETLRCQYARVAFVSPGFLNFIELVFKSFLSPIVGQNTTPTIVLLASKLKENWQNHISKLPSVVIELIKRDQTPEVLLTKAVFEIALQDAEYARLYGFIDDNQTIREDLLETLRGLLTYPSTSTILNDLVFMTMRAKSEIPLLVEDDRTAVPGLFDRRLLSDVDFNASAALSVNGRMAPPLSYKVRSWRMPGVAEESIHNQAELTMVGRGQKCEAALRHLLQKADPIPKFSVVPEGMSIDEFFDVYIVKRGPRLELNTRREYMNALEAYHVFDSEASVIAVLNKVKLERKKEIRALSAFTKILETSQRLDECGTDSCIRVQSLQDYISVVRLLAQYGTSRQDVKDYFKKPAYLLNDFLELSQYVAKNGPAYMRIRLQERNIYRYLTAGFNFDIFRQVRADLTAADIQITHYMAENTEEMLIKCFYPDGKVQEPVQGKFDKRNYMYTRCNELKKQDELIEVFKGACEESNPLRKAREMDRGIRMAITFMGQGFPPNAEIGADETLPMTLAYLIIANPPFTVSNLVYLRQYCSTDFGGEISDYSSRTLTSLIAICNQIQGLDIQKYIDSQ